MFSVYSFYDHGDLDTVSVNRVCGKIITYKQYDAVLHK